MAGGQCTTDRHCPTKTLSVRGDTWPDQPCVPANFFCNGKRLNPRTSTSVLTCFCCTVDAIWNQFWSITGINAASEPSAALSKDVENHSINLCLHDRRLRRRRQIFVIWLFQDRRRHIADGITSGIIYTWWCLFWSWRTFGNASLIPNRQRFFVVSILICMFQDSVPAGSYNDPFLSSVISMVTPTWCHGPTWGNLRCGVNAWQIWHPNSHILIW